MHKAVISVAFVAVILLAPIGLREVHSSVGQRGVQQIKGIVVDASTNERVDGAELEVVDAGARRLAQAVSLINGQFQIGTRADGGILVVTAPGFATYRRSVTRMPSDAVIRLQRSAELKGVVRHVESDALVNGIVVTVSYDADNIVQRAEPFESGSFTLTGLLPSRTTVVIRPRGLAPWSAELTLRPGQAVALPQVRLETPGAVAGRAVTATGAPLAGATIRIRYHDRMAERELLESLVHGRLTTDADGRFWIYGVIPGKRLSVLAEAGTRKAATGPFITAPGQMSGAIQLVLKD